MLRTCRPSARITLVGSTSFSSTSAWTPHSRNSLASIMPVGPPPANDHVNHEDPNRRDCLSASCSAQSADVHTRN